MSKNKNNREPQTRPQPKMIKVYNAKGKARMMTIAEYESQKGGRS